MYCRVVCIHLTTYVESTSICLFLQHQHSRVVEVSASDDLLAPIYPYPAIPANLPALNTLLKVCVVSVYSMYIRFFAYGPKRVGKFLL